MDLQKEILKCLSFYDIFEHPLTPSEVWRNLEIKTELTDALAALEELEREGKIMQKDGYFFLPQDENLAEKRKARFLVASRKLQKARRLAKFFSFFPFVRFVGVCNSLGYFNANPENDIDFFIIANRGRVWTARLLTTLPLIILNLRPKTGNMRDKFCLSFYVADDALDISAVALPGGDPYLYHWLSWIMPLYDGGVWQEFIAQNGWIKNYFSNFLAQDAVKAAAKPLIGRLAEKLFFLPEKFLRWGQMLAMPRELKEATGRGDGSVVISDRMLKFHLLDRRAEYKKNYELRIMNYA